MSQNDLIKDQVKNESEIQPSEKKKNKGQGKNSFKGVQNGSFSGIAKLREQLEKSKIAQKALEVAAEKRRSNTPTIVLSDNFDSIDLEYSVQVHGKRFTSVQPMVKGDLAKLLAPVIAPFVRVANAALQAQDLQKLKEAHQRNPEGKLTGEPLKHEGEQLYVVNPIDDLRSMWKTIEQSESAMKAVRALSVELSKLDFDKMPNVTLGKTHSSTYDIADSIAAAIGEIKNLKFLSGPERDPSDNSR